MVRVKIYGAGSVGNHLAQAARRMNWHVTITDRDPNALRRMREEIYPLRYGTWDTSIEQYVVGKEPKGVYDIIMVGTPPDVRIPIARSALDERPQLMLLEKPLCGPEAKGLKELIAAAKKQNTTLLVGYDHGVAESVTFVASLFRKRAIGEVLTLDVEFREHWEGIFNAHPWLSGPQDSYLGFTKRGGGASGEHSHALHLWQYFAQEANLGTWREMSHVYDWRKERGALYDAIAAFTFRTDKGKVGRVVQDVVTKPMRKWARAQGTDGFVEWICNGDPRGDVVRWMGIGGTKTRRKVFAKKRPDDFYREMKHVRDVLAKKIRPNDSPISIESGIRVIEVLKTAYYNHAGTQVAIRPL